MWWEQVWLQPVWVRREPAQQPGVSVQQQLVPQRAVSVQQVPPVVPPQQEAVARQVPLVQLAPLGASALREPLVPLVPLPEVSELQVL